MEARLCRFCLSKKNYPANPLISPCQCKGSMEFVHFKCLNRWRNVDIERNGRTCSLCLTNYRLPQLHQYELIPGINSCSLYILNYPGLTLSLYHYVFVVIMSSNHQPRNQIILEVFYTGSQYIYHMLYFGLMAYKWNVRNKRLYLAQIKTPLPFFFLLFHAWFFFFLEQHPYIIGPILSFYLTIYWKFHVKLLETINELLLEMELQQ